MLERKSPIDGQFGAKVAGKARGLACPGLDLGACLRVTHIDAAISNGSGQ